MTSRVGRFYVLSLYQYQSSQDEALRKHGFKIYSRPTWYSALWVRAGKVFTLQEALDIASYEKAMKDGDEPVKSRPY